MPLTEAQIKAKKKYYEKNKEKEKLQNYLRTAKMFIRQTDSIEKLEELKSMIKEKIKELEKGID